MARDAFTDAAGKVTIKGVQTDSFWDPLGNKDDFAKDGAGKGYSIALDSERIQQVIVFCPR
ncbi:MAG: hypothetical protein Q6373_005090 [Candidatus Sigynarchaeota archaeon]